MRHTNLLLVTTLFLTVVLSACAAPAQMAGSGSANTSGTGAGSMPSASMLPKEMQSAPARVKTAYQFAITNPDALKNVPCYCGCGSMGHTSNLSCYVKDRKGDEITFDQHALGCSLCVDISQDVMRMTGEGKSPQAIRAQIVAAYSKFGPANQ